MSTIDTIYSYAAFAAARIQHTFSGFADLRLKDWIRLVTVVGAYVLLRPYLVKIGERLQMKGHEKSASADGIDAAREAQVNSLRGGVQIPEDTDSESDEDTARKGADWGKKARRRQRKAIKGILAEEERRRELEDVEDDKDIEEFMLRYCQNPADGPGSG